MSIKTYLTTDDILAMIEATDNLRDRVILTFLSDAGCRVSELLRVRVRDVDLDSRSVMIPHLKRGVKKTCPCGHNTGPNQKFCVKCGRDISKIKPEGIEERSRLITIGQNTADLLSQWLDDDSLRGDPETPLFKITRHMVYHVVRKAATGAGISAKEILNPETGQYHWVHPHSFRDSLAASWLTAAGSDSTMQKALQEHLGHKSFDTTMRYHKLNPSTVRKVSDQVRQLRFGKP